ncbi:MAG: sigma-54 dependent transcriptional regulator [Myxococcota bacterium]|mgnify:CR=1 FL=1|nr:sigma-54 dependent transcriptional regulator [Myxococcota bacterium]MDP6244323.1 sigma-54 dependent transcriptional regulator [Myxococcota bacterium]MDP7076389.1 sigma-54 dependent transcriptional regulator [Myxococcota bacterium]MDP7299494.1 sigma-54 dependent transcriptional regulator [Myxococcota bacterium]MDP7432117.1 sigma-54 dependent transcriptional regulator [Myxococcota bacterium]
MSNKGSDERIAPKRPRALVVDDAVGIRSYVAGLLELHGWEVDTAEDGRNALALIEGGAAPDVVLLDVMMPGLDGPTTLERIRSSHLDLPVVMLSVDGKASTIVECMRLGAADYLNKPFDEEELEAVLTAAVESSADRRKREGLAADSGDLVSTAVWASPAMGRVRDIVEHVANTDVTVLIQGESGSGKEVVARTLHAVSERSHAPFIKVNCAALPADLLESELFGYEKGAFTGAVHRKLGKFEFADRGTIFLDEIGEMSFALQAKLLQVLQEATFFRLGGNDEVRVRIRVVCATNRNLEEMVRGGRFREDLFFRLNVVNLVLPPLRERREEIPELAAAFARRFAVHYSRPISLPSESLLRSFERYAFPGNVRELENMMKRIVVLETEEPILREIARYDGGVHGSSRLRQLIEAIEATAGEMPLREVGRVVALEAERATIGRVLNQTNWNRKQAALLLGVSYKTLLQKIKNCALSQG